MHLFKVLNKNQIIKKKMIPWRCDFSRRMIRRMHSSNSTGAQVFILSTSACSPIISPSLSPESLKIPIFPYPLEKLKKTIFAVNCCTAWILICDCNFDSNVDWTWKLKLLGLQTCVVCRVCEMHDRRGIWL